MWFGSNSGIVKYVTMFNWKWNHGVFGSQDHFFRIPYSVFLHVTVLTQLPSLSIFHSGNVALLPIMAHCCFFLSLPQPTDLPRLPETISFNSRRVAEFTHSFVATGVVHFATQNGPSLKDEVVWPARQLSATASQHIGTAIIENLEHLFGMDLESAIEELANKKVSLNLVCVGDAASANLKCASLLFSHVLSLGQKNNVVVTANFSHCGLHQMCRILALHLERQALKAALFSISRLHQHSSIRDDTRDALLVLLRRRFRFRQNARPPLCTFTSSHMRDSLFQLLTGSWPGEGDSESMSDRSTSMQNFMKFFNGNLLDQDEWSHYCSGPDCCADQNAAFQTATRREKMTQKPMFFQRTFSIILIMRHGHGSVYSRQ